MGSSVMDFFSREMDVLIIGKTLGAESLGVYTLSKQIVIKIYSLINPVVLTVFNPLFSSIQTRKEKLREVYLKLIHTLTLINLPIYLIVVALSKEILGFMYGSSYVSGYHVLGFLAIAYAINSLSNPVGSLQIATGRTDIGFKWTIFRVTISAMTLFYSARYGVDVTAASLAFLNFILIVPFYHFQIYNMIQVGFLKYFKTFGNPLFVFLIISMFYLYYISDYYIWSNVFLVSISKALFAIFLLFIVLFIIHRKGLIEFFNMFKFYVLKIK
ncbi:hypothetical protein GCM10028791_41580 [Echinicola sediminis]